MVKALHFVSEDGTDHFDTWLRKQSSEARARIQTRIARVRLGNFGDHHGVGEGVFELRVHFGSGYRLYYGRDGDELVILLAGGTKKRQAGDIEAAQANWRVYRQEKRNAHKRT